MQTLFKKLEYNFLVESTKIDNITFPYKTALSMLRQIEWAVQIEPITKNRVLPVTKYFSFSKILFQFRNLLYRVDLVYQPSKCPYSYFSKALEFYFSVFFLMTILKKDLNAAEIRTVQYYVCTKN